MRCIAFSLVWKRDFLKLLFTRDDKIFAVSRRDGHPLITIHTCAGPSGIEPERRPQEPFLEIPISNQPAFDSAFRSQLRRDGLAEESVTRPPIVAAHIYQPEGTQIKPYVAAASGSHRVS